MALACLFALPAAAAPLEAYGKLPAIESATVSPSGHAVAMVVTNGDQRSVVVKDLASGAITLRGLLGDYKIRSLQWAGDKHLVVVHSATTTSFQVTNGWREWYFGNVINVETKKMRRLLNAEKADLAAIFDYPVVRNYKGEPAVFVQGVVFTGGQGVLSLFRVDLDTGAGRLVATGVPDTIDWVVDPQGEVVGQELYQAGSGKWTLRVRSNGGWRDAASATARVDRPYLIGLGRDGSTLLYASKDGAERWSWREVRADGGAPGAPAPASDAQGALRAAQDGRMIGRYEVEDDEHRYVFFDPADAKAWKAIEDAFPNEAVQLESWSNDRKKIVVRVDFEAKGPAYAIVDMTTRSASWLGAEYAELQEGDIGPRQAVSFKAADGLALSGYLTLPKGRAAKNLPLVVLPHGGPASRDDPGFDWWAQAIASRGYAVLQVNFRGSDGLGTEFLEAGYGEWGRKMQTDLSDGVRHLTAQGTVDPKRVCIMGGSYGGYAAMAGATLDRGVYRCAVAVAGVFDLRRMVDGEGVSAQRYWKRFMGVDSLKDDRLAAISPALHADKVDVPVLLIHGKDDTVVPIEQSRIMAEALKRAGKPFDFVTMKGEDHWLSRGDSRLTMLQSAVAFLEKHNPPQ